MHDCKIQPLLVCLFNNTKLPYKEYCIAPLVLCFDQFDRGSRQVKVR